MLTPGVVLYHHNPCPHIAASTQELLEHLTWELFDHLTASVV
jgi:hypothetical protein